MVANATLGLQVTAKVMKLSGDVLWKTLTKEGILARRYFYPGCHRMQPFGTLDQYEPLYHTDKLAKRCLVLPGGQYKTQRN